MKILTNTTRKYNIKDYVLVVGYAICIIVCNSICY